MLPLSRQDRHPSALLDENWENCIGTDLRFKVSIMYLQRHQGLLLERLVARPGSVGWVFVMPEWKHPSALSHRVVGTKVVVGTCRPIYDVGVNSVVANHT